MKDLKGKTMANKSKTKGTAAETRVVKYLKDHGFTEAKRIALHGSKDMGDVEVGTGFHILEVKAGKQAGNVNRKLFEEWKAQTLTEQGNQRTDKSMSLIYCYLLIVPPNKPLKDCLVYSFDNPWDVNGNWYSCIPFDLWVKELADMYLEE